MYNWQQFLGPTFGEPHLKWTSTHQCTNMDGWCIDEWTLFIPSCPRADQGNDHRLTFSFPLPQPLLHFFSFWEPFFCPNLSPPPKSPIKSNLPPYIWIISITRPNDVTPHVTWCHSCFDFFLFLQKDFFLKKHYFPKANLTNLFFSKTQQSFKWGPHIGALLSTFHFPNKQICR